MSKLLMSLYPSLDKVVAAANVLTNLAVRPALIELLSMYSLETKLLRRYDGLLLHHNCVQPAADSIT